MATAKTDTSPELESGKSGPPEKKEVEVTSEDVAKYIKKEIKTPDDAVAAYLHGDIEEDELRKALAVFGVTTLDKPKVERIDAAYERKIPDDLFDVPTTPYDDYEYRKEQVDAKQEERDAAVAAAEGETRDQTVAREQAALNARNTGEESVSRSSVPTKNPNETGALPRASDPVSDPAKVSGTTSKS